MTLVDEVATVDAVNPGPAGAVDGVAKGSRWTRFQDRWPELLLTLAGLVLYGWGLGTSGWANTYYSAAARSMSASWHNFFYASLDPGGWITVDKPPAAMWTQALSVRVFGFHPWSVLLPSVLCGALSVWLLMATVRRVWGRPAGLVAGGALALTPMMLAVSRSNNPDITLVLCVVLAAWATQRGIEDGRLRWMLLAGFACGLGFLAKLLAAGLVMPGLWGAYLLCAKPRFRTRFLQCLLGAAVFFAVSVAWVGLVDVHSLAHRPWIGGSTDGTAQDLVFGYNGFGRITGASEGGGGFQVGAGAFGGGGFGPGATGGIDEFGGPTGIGRLFNAGMGDQVMWLAPIAVVSALVGLWTAIRRRKRDARLGSIVMFSGWAIVVYGVFAFAEGTYHNYYVSLLAPALAGLVGIAVAQARDARVPGRIAVVVALVATVVTQVILLRRVDAWSWLRYAVPIGVAIAIGVGLVAVWRAPARRRIVAGSLVVAGVTLALAPAAWSVAGVRTAPSGTFPEARPASGEGTPFGPGGPGGVGGPGGPGGFGGGAGAGEITADEWAWLDDHRHGERWVLGVSSAMEASGPIIEGHDVVALGGFTGSDNAATPARVAKLVDDGSLRFLSLGGGFGGFGGLSGAVSTACDEVDPAEWGGSGQATVYDCKGQGDALRAAGEAAAASGPAGGVPSGGLPPGGGLPSNLPQGALEGVDVEALTACLDDHDITVDSGDNVDFTDPAFTAAMQACSAYLPSGAFPGGGPPAGLRQGGGPPTTG